jgi:hypothetical protein
VALDCSLLESTRDTKAVRRGAWSSLKQHLHEFAWTCKRVGIHGVKP